MKIQINNSQLVKSSSVNLGGVVHFTGIINNKNVYIRTNLFRDTLEPEERLIGFLNLETGIITYFKPDNLATVWNSAKLILENK